MATSPPSPPPSVARGFSLLRHSAAAFLAAVATFLIAIVSPPLVLLAAAVSVLGALNRKPGAKVSATMMAAVATGCVVAAATYAALAVVNADSRGSGSGREVVSPVTEGAPAPALAGSLAAGKAPGERQ